MPLGLHWPELLLLVGLLALFFGPKRLPELGSSIGKTIKEFQKSMREVTAPADEKAPTAALPVAAQPARQALQIAAPAEPSPVETTAER